MSTQPDSTPHISEVDELIDDLIDKTCTPIYDGKVVTGNLITHRFVEDLQALLDHHTQAVLDSLIEQARTYEVWENDETDLTTKFQVKAIPVEAVREAIQAVREGK